MLNQNYTTAVLLFFSFSVMQNPVLGASAHRHSVKPYVVPTLAVISIAGWGVWKYFGPKKAHSDKHKSLPREEQAKGARNEILSCTSSVSYDNPAKASPQSTIESSPSLSAQGYLFFHNDEALLKAIDLSNPLPLHVSLSASIVKYSAEKDGHILSKSKDQRILLSWQSEQETLDSLKRHTLYNHWLCEKGFYAHCAKLFASSELPLKLSPLGVDNRVAVELYDNFMHKHGEFGKQTWYLIAYSLRTALKDCANLGVSSLAQVDEPEAQTSTPTEHVS